MIEFNLFYIKIDLINPNYYDINDGWANKTVLSETECKKLCLNDSSCVFVIHFYRNQLNASDLNTNNRKPLNNAPMNTCVLRSQFKIEFGTQKDSSSKIHYLTGI